MDTPLPLVNDIVLVGGGHAHALVLLAWAMKPMPGVRLTLINPEPTAPYSGMLPGFVAGHYQLEELDIDLVRLARHAGARLVLDRAVGLDRGRRRVLLANRPPIAYDLASIDIGITTDLPAIPGFADHALPAKPLHDFARRWEAFVARARGQAPRLVMIGGGVAGVELALAMAYRLRQAGATPHVTIIEAGPDILPTLGRATRAALRRHLNRAGISIIADATVAEIGADHVRLADGRRLAADLVVGAAGAHPQGWLADTGLALHEGFVRVGPTLQSVSDPAIFAAGDIAHLDHAPRPKAGVYAVREAPILHHNLRAALSGRRLRRYRPQRDFLKLISTGGKGAVADKWNLPLDGAWLWRWKDRIDRRFMRMFADLPEMAPPRLPRERPAALDQALGDAPLCGGCGAKVGPGALGRVLEALPASPRSDILAGAGDDAAILACGQGRQVVTTDHLRAVVEDPWLMTRIAAVHALGDVLAMGAEPQAALAQIILPRMSERMQAETLREIMEAAAEIFGAAGAAIVGGHTSMGHELTVGFTVTGLVERPITLAGARPGDALILTRPLGTGVILAAEMRKKARGEDAAHAWAMMARPQIEAGRLLARHARAMTDVTGFGLAGHLLEMLDASGVAATVAAAALPLLPGARPLAEAGIRSTIWPANTSAAAGRMRFRPGPVADLLFDPQTGGGLLAAVPPEAAEALLAALRAHEPDAAIIGQVTEGAPFITLEGGDES